METNCSTFFDVFGTIFGEIGRLLLSLVAGFIGAAVAMWAKEGSRDGR